MYIFLLLIYYINYLLLCQKQKQKTKTKTNTK